MASRIASLTGVMVLITIVLSASAGNIQAQQTPQVRQVTLYQTRFGFNGTKGGPDIVVNQGDTVRIKVTGNDTVIHDWVLDADSPSPYNAKSARIRTVGNTTTVEFVAAYPGTFKYYCSVAFTGSLSRRQRGMEGNFIVNARPSADLSAQVKTLEDQVKSLISSVNQLTSEQRNISGQSSLLLGLSAVAILLSIAAIAISISSRRKKA